MHFILSLVLILLSFIFRYLISIKTMLIVCIIIFIFNNRLRCMLNSWLGIFTWTFKSPLGLSKEGVMFGTDYHIEYADGWNHDNPYDVFVLFFTRGAFVYACTASLSSTRHISHFFVLCLLLAVSPSPRLVRAPVQSCRRRRRLVFYLLFFFVSRWLYSYQTRHLFCRLVLVLRSVFWFVYYRFIVIFQYLQTSYSAFVLVRTCYRYRVV